MEKIRTWHILQQSEPLKWLVAKEDPMNRQIIEFPQEGYTFFQLSPDSFLGDKIRCSYLIYFGSNNEIIHTQTPCNTYKNFSWGQCSVNFSNAIKIETAFACEQLV